MIAALCLFSICTTAFANNNNVKVASKLDAKDVKNRIVTTVTIQDVKSGFVSSYNVEDENIKCSRSADGKEMPEFLGTMMELGITIKLQEMIGQKYQEVTI